MMEDLMDVEPPSFITPLRVQNPAEGGGGGEGRRRSVRIAVARGRQRKIYSDSEDDEDDKGDGDKNGYDKNKKRKSGPEVPVKPKPATGISSRKRKLDNWEIGSGIAPSAPVPVVYPLVALGRQMKTEGPGPEWLLKEEEVEVVEGPEEPQMTCGSGDRERAGGEIQIQDKPVKVEEVEVVDLDEEEDDPMCQIRIVDIRSLVEPEELEEEQMSPPGVSPAPQQPPSPISFTLPQPPPMFPLPPPLKIFFDEDEEECGTNGKGQQDCLEDPLELPSSIDDFRGREDRIRCNLISTTTTLAPPLRALSPTLMPAYKNKKKKKSNSVKEVHPKTSPTDDGKVRIWDQLPRCDSEIATAPSITLPLPANLKFKKLERPSPAPAVPVSPPWASPLLPLSSLTVPGSSGHVIVGRNGNVHNILGCGQVVSEGKLMGYSKELTLPTTICYNLKKIIYVQKLSKKCDGKCLYYLFNTGNNIRNIQVGSSNRHAVVTFAQPCHARNALEDGRKICHDNRVLSVTQYSPQPHQIVQGTNAIIPVLPNEAQKQVAKGPRPGWNTANNTNPNMVPIQKPSIGKGTSATLPSLLPQSFQLKRTVTNDRFQSNASGHSQSLDPRLRRRPVSPPPNPLEGKGGSWSFYLSSSSPPQSLDGKGKSRSFSSSSSQPPPQSLEGNGKSRSYYSASIPPSSNGSTPSHPSSNGGVTLDAQWYQRYKKLDTYTSFE